MEQLNLHGDGILTSLGTSSGVLLIVSVREDLRQLLGMKARGRISGP